MIRKGLKITNSVLVAPVLGGIFNTDFVFAQGGELLGLERGYYKDVDDYHFQLTLKGALIALTFGYLWNKDFHKFADDSFGLEWQKLLFNLVSPSLFWMPILVGLLRFCWTHYKVIENFAFNRGEVHAGDVPSTRWSSKNGENDSVISVVDVNEGYIFSPVEEDGQGEHIIFENPEYKS